jgi:hypothetical protein
MVCSRVSFALVVSTALLGCGTERGPGLLARDGVYIAAAQRSLVAPARPEPPVEGIVIEVTG